MFVQAWLCASLDECLIWVCLRYKCICHWQVLVSETLHVPHMIGFASQVQGLPQPASPPHTRVDASEARSCSTSRVLLHPKEGLACMLA